MEQKVLRHPVQYDGCLGSLLQSVHFILNGNGTCKAFVKDNKGTLNKPQLHRHISVVWG